MEMTRVDNARPRTTFRIQDMGHAIRIARRAFSPINTEQVTLMEYGHRSDRLMACAQQLSIITKFGHVSFYIDGRERPNKDADAVRLNIHISRGRLDQNSRVNDLLARKLLFKYHVTGFSLDRRVKPEHLYDFFSAVLLNKSVDFEVQRHRGINLISA